MNLFGIRPGGGGAGSLLKYLDTTTSFFTTTGASPRTATDFADNRVDRRRTGCINITRHAVVAAPSV